MATNETISSIKQTPTTKRDENTNTNWQAATTMTPSRKTALAAGVFFLISDMASIAAVLLYGSVLTSPNYIVGSGSEIIAGN